MYPRIEKAVNKVYRYLFGLPIVIETDTPRPRIILSFEFPNYLKLQIFLSISRQTYSLLKFGTALAQKSMLDEEKGTGELLIEITIFTSILTSGIVLLLTWVFLIQDHAKVRVESQR